MALMLGNEAVARGLVEADCSFVSSYPGTPSTEITEIAAKSLYAEWAPNEKVAAEAAFGASMSGARAFSAMKHVGLNVAADPLFTSSYTGVGGGLVICVADDPGMHSSQNEQDSRHYAEAAKLPMLEPSDSEECRDFTKLAFKLSERFDTPVLLRLTTRVSHSRSNVTEEEPIAFERWNYVKNPAKFVMVPNNARTRHTEVEKRMIKLGDYCETAAINKLEPGKKHKIGVIAAGITYQTAREALGNDASYLKLGMVYPLPVEPIKKLANEVEELWVLEELDDFIETHCKKHGIKVRGKSNFSPLGEYTAENIRKVILGIDNCQLSIVNCQLPEVTPALPARPPAMCPGCPHRGVFYVLNKLKLTVFGDIGCYTLGASPPLSAMDMTLCMGASVSALHGFLKADPSYAGKTVGVIGDSTFMHSGLTGLLNAVYNNTPSTLIILDNSITGMTGHQQNPATGRTLTGAFAPSLDLEVVCHALGVDMVDIVDPGDPAAAEKLIKKHLSANAPSVIIAQSPCVLLPGVKSKPPLKVEACRDCKACTRIGCPAISFGKGGAEIDASLCVGCGLCVKLCKFDCIRGCRT
ncbi:indolepyruvate oxidoreductase subunit IorA [Clostridia bacterium]|nr:indolepyruvate oxidoreductase subunit IorA [Clostridia bacterium]